MTAPKGLDELYKGRLVARGDITYEVVRNDGRVARLAQVSPARPMGGDLAVDADDLPGLRLLTMTAAAARSRPARGQPGE